jgi:glycerophosphoryl diester phosphodiesterase
LIPALIVAGALGAIIGVLVLRERRHQPLSFVRYFPGFKPMIASHRGYGKYGVIAENTLPAFTASEKLGFRAHEFDVRRTADGEVALLHGPRLENTTNGHGRIEAHYLADIRKLDAAHYLTRQKHNVKHKPVTLPTLREVFAQVPAHSALNVEIKRDRWDLSPGLEDLTVRVVTLENAEKRVCFSGFHFLTLWNLRRYRSGIPVGLLIEPGPWAIWKLHLYRFILLPDNIHLHYSTATPDLMASLKKRGYGLAFWTVNDEDVVRGLFELGADVVITDKMEFIKKFPSQKTAVKKRRN